MQLAKKQRYFLQQRTGKKILENLGQVYAERLSDSYSE